MERWGLRALPFSFDRRTAVATQVKGPYHQTTTFDIPDEVSIEEAYATYGLDGRLIPTTDGQGTTRVDGNGTTVAFIGRTVQQVEALAAPTRRAREPWFVCPVSGDWLPVSAGARYRGTLYSAVVAADLQRDAVRQKSAPDSPAHWSDDGSTMQT